MQKQDLCTGSLVPWEKSFKKMIKFLGIYDKNMEKFNKRHDK